MKKKLVILVKYFKFLYRMYYYLFGIIVKILSLFIKPDDTLILINSFGGKKYDDSPKAIYEAMLRDKRFDKYKFVWAFHEPEKFTVERARIIKTDTFTYFATALKAQVWVTNSSIERGLHFKPKHTFYFNTWHGTPLKKMGTDISKENKSFSTKSKSSIDIMTAQSDFEADIFSRVFGIERNKFLMCGLPRNDVLAQYTEKQRCEIKQKLGLPENKRIILYAPTFREYERDDKLNCTLVPPMDIKKWESELKSEYCLLFRAHYEVSSMMNIEETDFVKNMTNYPVLSDLMIAADILITDYSSIMFDFSIMDKPIFHFCYDYDKYQSKRGMYFDVRDQFDGADNEQTLIDKLKNVDYDVELIKVKNFRSKYLNYYGNAIAECLDSIISNV